MAEESLLDQETTEETTETTATTGTTDAGWFHAEGVAGEGDAPEWLKGDKFKSVAAQAEAYKGLESKLGGFVGAPEEYEMSMPEGVEGDFFEDNPLMDGFREIAAKSNMSQDTFTDLLHSYISNEVAMGGTSMETEMAALGDNAQNRLKSIGEWGKANMSEDNYKGLLGITTTAEGVKAVEALIAKTRTPQIPVSDVATRDTSTNHSDLKARVADPRYQTDPAFRAETQKMYQNKFGNEPKHTVI